MREAAAPLQNFIRQAAEAAENRTRAIFAEPPRLPTGTDFPKINFTTNLIFY